MNFSTAFCSKTAAESWRRLTFATSSDCGGDGEVVGLNWRKPTKAFEWPKMPASLFQFLFSACKWNESLLIKYGERDEFQQFSLTLLWLTVTRQASGGSQSPHKTKHSKGVAYSLQVISVSISTTLNKSAKKRKKGGGIPFDIVIVGSSRTYRRTVASIKRRRSR